MLLSLLVLAPALAQDVPCEIMREPVLLDLINEVDGHISTFDLDLANTRAEEVYGRLPCLVTPLKPSLFTRFARQRATLAFFQQDEEGVIRWGMAARFGLAQYPWPPDIGEDHPVRETIGFGEEPLLVELNDQVLVPPKRGVVLVNGHAILTPAGRESTPQLVQVLDREGNVLDGYWQEGANFAPERLAAEGKPPDLPKFFVPEDPEAAIAAGEAMYAAGAHIKLPETTAPTEEPDAPGEAVATPKPKPPEEKIPDLPVDLSLEELPAVAAEYSEEDGWIAAETEAPGEPAVATLPPTEPPGPGETTVATGPGEPEASGRPEKTPRPPRERPEKTGGGGLPFDLTRAAIAGGAALAAGALYGAASASQGGMTRAGTESELLGVRSRTNLLVMGSGIAGVAAVGLGVTAFISADGARIGIQTRF